MSIEIEMEDTGWWVPKEMFGIYRFVDSQHTRIANKYQSPQEAIVEEIGFIDKPTHRNKMRRIWRVSDCTDPSKSAMYRVTLSWGKPGSLTMVTDGVLYFPLINASSDEWRWDQTTLGIDAGDIAIKAIMEKIERDSNEDHETG